MSMRPMRKASRRKDPEWALEVFDRAPYITFSLTRPDGTPYGVPLSMARRDARTFYFSTAPPRVRNSTASEPIR